MLHITYIDIEISGSQCVAVRGREVTRVVGDVDVAMVTDLEGAIPENLGIENRKSKFIIC